MLCAGDVAFAKILFFAHIDRDRAVLEPLLRLVRRNLGDVLLGLRDELLKTVWLFHDAEVLRSRRDAASCHAMRRYLQIYAIMLRNSLIREMSFKANFILWMLVEVLWFCGQILFFSIIFGQVDRIGDWTKWEVVLLVGTHQIIAQLFQAFFFVNISNIPELVRTGKLDSLLVLPIDSQFAASTKQFGLDSVINAIVGAAVVCVSLSRLGVIPGPMSILLYLTAIGFGVAV